MKTIKKLALLLGAILWFQFIDAQFTLKGILKNYEYGENIAGVKVFIDTMEISSSSEKMWKLMDSDSGNSQTDSTGFFQITALAKKRINLIFCHKSYEYLVISGIIPDENIDLGSIFLFRSSFRACGPNYSDVYEGILNKYPRKTKFYHRVSFKRIKKRIQLKAIYYH